MNLIDKLQKINNDAVKGKQITKKVFDREEVELKERVQYVAKKSGNKKLQSLIDRGAFDPREREVVDRNVTKEIEREVELKVRALGVKPSKDNFVRMVERELKRRIL